MGGGSSQTRGAPNLIPSPSSNYSGRFASNALLRGGGSSNQQSVENAMHTPIHNNLVGGGGGTTYFDMDPAVVQFVQTYEPAKFASKRNGVVASYAANTH